MSTRHSLYDGEVEVLFSNIAKNRYLVNGEAKVGVTTILRCLAKEGLALWPLNMAISYLKDLPVIDHSDLEYAAKAHVRRSDKGKDVGTLVHQAIEAYLKKENPLNNLTPEAASAFGGFMEWYEAQEDIEVVEIERVVYSQTYDYCGTVDGIFRIDGQIVMVDWKTTNSSKDAPLGIYPEYFLQLGGYALAYEEEVGEVIDKLLVVNVGKDGNIKLLSNDRINAQKRDLKHAFASIVEVYENLQYLTKKIKEIK